MDGRDVEPGWEPCDDCTPRGRLYATSAGFRGVPEGERIDAALVEAVRG